MYYDSIYIYMCDMCVIIYIYYVFQNLLYKNIIYRYIHIYILCVPYVNVYYIYIYIYIYIIYTYIYSIRMYTYRYIYLGARVTCVLWDYA